MNRDVPTLELRGCDQVLLEAQLPEILRRPIGQIAPVNVMDLVELSTTDGRPKATERALQRFVTEIPRQLADIPRGKSWETYLTDLEEIEGDRVPHAFRAMVAAESKTRPDSAGRVDALLAKWSAAEPAPFSMDARKVRIQRATMVEPTPEPARGDRATRAPREPREGGERAPKAPKAPKPERPAVVVDIERRDFVIQQCLERLGRTSSDKGLLEAVLLAGVKHAAKEKYPDMIPGEITAILRQLQNNNRVRYSAGRWMPR